MDQSNLINSSVSRDIKELFNISFKFYTNAEKNKTIYKKEENIELVKKLIELYYRNISPSYEHIDILMRKFRHLYIASESLVEKNDSSEEKKGLGLAYDYIEDYDIKKNAFNIFTSSILIHQRIYKYLDEQKTISPEEIKKRKEAALAKAFEAKKNKDLKLLKEAEQEYKNIPESDTFGGRLRTEAVGLKDSSVEVPSAEEARKFFNTFAGFEKNYEFTEKLNSKDIFEYIDYCVKTTADLIYYQPFRDGNKRTFRSLLNLMFKLKNIPPVYIKKDERIVYKDALLKALTHKDYKDLQQFYYFKICDSIYVLDIKQIDDKKDELDNDDFLETRNKEFIEINDESLGTISRRV